MIDYEKIKQAYCILLKWLDENIEIQKTHVKVTWVKEDPYNFGYAEGFLMCYQEVKEKLQELTDTQPKPKYQVGQQVWYADDSGVGTFVIRSISGNPVLLWSDGWSLCEEDCYPTREAVIEAQIDWWQSLRSAKEEKDMTPKFEGEVVGFNCTHNFNGIMHKEQDKCINCGVAC